MSRVRMRLRPLPVPSPADAPPYWRSLRTDDQERLGPLLWRAYRGTIDDNGETLGDAAAEVQRLYAGTYGRLLLDCSCVIAEAERMISAAIVTVHDGAPLLAFSITEPSCQKQGLASALMRASCARLAATGFDELRLVVTDGNVAAQRLYARLGFAAVRGDPRA